MIFILLQYTYFEKIFGYKIVINILVIDSNSDSSYSLSIKADSCFACHILVLVHYYSSNQHYHRQFQYLHLLYNLNHEQFL